MRFLNKVIQIHELKASDVLLEFLKSKNSKNVSKMLKAAGDKQKKPEDASQFMTIEGEYLMSDDPSILQFSEKYQMYTNSYEMLAKQFYTLTKQLSGQYSEISNTQKKMAQGTKLLSGMFKTSMSEHLSEM